MFITKYYNLVGVKIIFDAFEKDFSQKYLGKVLINANILVKFDVKPTEALLLFNEIKI